MARKETQKVRGVYEHPKGSDVWWIQYFDQRRRHRERIGRRTLAIAVREKRRTEIREGRYFPTANGRAALFDDLLTDYREWAKREAGRSSKAEGCYARLLGVVRRQTRDAITLADVERFSPHSRRPVSFATVNRNLTLLRAIFNRERSPLSHQDVRRCAR